MFGQLSDRSTCRAKCGIWGRRLLFFHSGRIRGESDGALSWGLDGLRPPRVWSPSLAHPSLHSGFGMTVAGQRFLGLYSYLAGVGWRLWAPRAPDEIENWGSARTAAEWAPKDRPKEGRCPFHYERGRRDASMIIACENPPSFHPSGGNFIFISRRRHNRLRSIQRARFMDASSSSFLFIAAFKLSKERKKESGVRS